MTPYSPSHFAFLKKAIVDKQSEQSIKLPPPFLRLSYALEDKKTYSPRTPHDLATLLRHALRYEMTRRQTTDAFPKLPVPKSVSSLPQKFWEAFGLHLEDSANGAVLTASPWMPQWIETKGMPVDENAARAEVVQQYSLLSHSPDPHLPQDKSTYRSPAQLMAVRSALTMPSGASLVISLPTGEGKSLVFESLSHFGPSTGLRGITPVIVPTVALALDHEKAMQQSLGTNRPMAYVGGTDSRLAIFKAIQEGEQGLCFMAPEAACGPLRECLVQACSNGLFSTLIIDEAHLVDSWGSDFRTDFQMLSALRMELIRACDEDRRLRTVMLSATLTQLALNTLEALFTDAEYPFGVINGSRLRPELQFFTATDLVPEDIRKQRVLEAMAHLPRPLILYASTREDVDGLYRLLRSTGYGNLAKFHGGTPTKERDRVLEFWRKGELDLVVGNSAFGLGIDYKHVRSVVHACLPETIDRFYQEVGRGGRDGRNSVSVMIPSHADRSVAENLNLQRIISRERGLQRWKSMFEDDQRKTIGTNQYRLRLNVAPSTNEEDIDMRSGRSIDWNARLLAVMARAGILRILARKTDRTAGIHTVDVELVRFDHESEGAWSSIDALRKDIQRSNLGNLKKIKDYMQGQVCIASLLEEIYTTSLLGKHECIQPVCRGCPACGPKGNGKPIYVPHPTPPWGMNRKLTSTLAARFDIRNLLVVEYPSRDLGKKRMQRELQEVFNDLHLQGMSNLLILGNKIDLLDTSIPDFGDHIPLFLTKSSCWLHERFLPPGPEMIFLLPDFTLNAPLKAGKPGAQRLVFMPDTMCDPSRNDVSYLSTHDGRTISFNTFRTQVRI